MEYVCLVVFMTFLVSFGQSQTTTFGFCPGAKPMQNFDVAKFEGTWNVIQNYPVPSESGATCKQYRFKMQDATTYAVDKLYNDANGIDIVINGTATLDNSNEGNMHLVLPYNSASRPFLVLDTDYTDYAVTYTCFPSWFVFRVEYVDILSKKSPGSVRSTAASLAYPVLDANGISKDPLVVEDHIGCTRPSNNFLADIMSKFNWV